MILNVMKSYKHMGFHYGKTPTMIFLLITVMQITMYGQIVLTIGFQVIPMKQMHLFLTVLVLMLK